MKVILRVTPELKGGGEISKEKILKFISEHFNDACADAGTHVIEDLEFYLGSEDLEFHLGSEDPHQLRELAEFWNVDIKNAAAQQMKALLDRPTLPMDTQETYRARLAIYELDNYWTDECDHLVLLPDSSDVIICKTIIPDCYMDDIQRAPEDYVIADIVTTFD